MLGAIWLCALLCCQQVSDRWQQLFRNGDHGLAVCFHNTEFVFGSLFVFRKLFVMLSESLDSISIPTWWKMLFDHRRLLRRCRRRYAWSGFPRNSNAVTTKMLSGSGSGT